MQPGEKNQHTQPPARPNFFVRAFAAYALAFALAFAVALVSLPLVGFWFVERLTAPVVGFGVLCVAFFLFPFVSRRLR
ncbi:fatty acid desaturase [Chiayiivirga flava]|uniref:Fatty acid desaturase n=1 Tax=Chiayiivirga flava TaxID=659595 RepID=A0A7W8D4X6_9GAMM|nr:fatty acid desaturase [Chiayiivirga flava]